MTLQGPRVTLRPWRADDVESFALMNADPRVMEFLPALLSRDEAAQMIARAQGAIEERGWGMWALQVDGRCIGFTGLGIPRFDAPFMPCVEVGWRLAHDAWGRGYATEAAQLALRYGFDELHLAEIVSYTTVNNLRSRRVMERLGMTRDPADDFLHPSMAAHPLQPHVLYRLQAAGLRA